MRNNKLAMMGLTALVLGCAGVTAFAQADPNANAGQTPANAGGRQGRQGRQGGPGQFGGQTSISSLSLATMDSGLKLSAAQKSQIQPILDKKTADIKALPKIQPPMPGDPPIDPTAMRDAFQKRRTITTDADKAIEAVLTDDQKKMLPDFLKELGSLQRAGIPSAIVGDLKLTDAKKKQILAMADLNQQAMQQKMQEAQQAGQNPRALRQDPAFQAMMKENADKIMALLSPTQHAIIDKYNKDNPQPAFGGFGGRGGAGGGGRRPNGAGGAGANPNGA